MPQSADSRPIDESRGTLHQPGSPLSPVPGAATGDYLHVAFALPFRLHREGTSGLPVASAWTVGGVRTDRSAARFRALTARQAPTCPEHTCRAPKPQCLSIRGVFV